MQNIIMYTKYHAVQNIIHTKYNYLYYYHAQYKIIYVLFIYHLHTYILMPIYFPLRITSPARQNFPLIRGTIPACCDGNPLLD